MTDDFKDEIRSRMAEVSHIYRGNDLDALVEEARTGTVTGSTHTVWTRSEPVIDGDSLEGEEVGSLRLFSASQQPVTGGFSDSLPQTHNFNGSGNTSLVLDPDSLPVSPIEYDYDYYNANTGVYAHVRSSIAGEVRHETPSLGGGPLGDLIGFTKSGPRSARDTTIVEEIERVELDGQNLPGTSTNSLIARESEWVAAAETVDISDAIEAVVTVNEPLGVRVAFTRGKDMVPGDAPPAGEIAEEVAAERAAELPPGVPYYFLVVDDIGAATERTPESWPERAIQHAVGPGGDRVPPSAVPKHIRGVNT